MRANKPQMLAGNFLRQKQEIPLRRRFRENDEKVWFFTITVTKESLYRKYIQLANMFLQMFLSLRWRWTLVNTIKTTSQKDINITMTFAQKKLIHKESGSQSFRRIYILSYS